MKKLLFILIILCAFLGAAASADNGPYLVCDPMSDENVTHFEIYLNGNIIEAEKYSVNATHFKIKHSVSDLAPGDYTAKARSANREWNATSEWSNVITFTVPSSSDMPACKNFQLN